MRATKILVMMGLMLSTLVFVIPVQAQPQPIKVLIVDETQTLLESLQVNILVKTARQFPTLSVDARFIEVESSFDNPLAKTDLQLKKYDLIVIVPLELNLLQTIWLVSRHPSTWSSQMSLAFVQLRSLIEQVFAQTGQKTMDVTQDWMPAFLAGIFQQSGWL